MQFPSFEGTFEGTYLLSIRSERVEGAIVFNREGLSGKIIGYTRVALVGTDP